MKRHVSKERKLFKYAQSSDLMNVSISYGNESFQFNLHNEIIIDEDRINHELKEQPSAYAFLGMLHKKLVRRAKDKEREMDKTYALLFIKNKGKIDEGTGRPLANDLVKEIVIASQRYQGAVKTFIEADHEKNIIETCVHSFEQRSNLIQTLSANIRKTN